LRPTPKGPAASPMCQPVMSHVFDTPLNPIATSFGKGDCAHQPETRWPRKLDIPVRNNRDVVTWIEQLALAADMSAPTMHRVVANP
jgi:hypothetical protein